MRAGSTPNSSMMSLRDVRETVISRGSLRRTRFCIFKNEYHRRFVRCCQGFHPSSASSSSSIDGDRVMNCCQERLTLCDAHHARPEALVVVDDVVVVTVLAHEAVGSDAESARLGEGTGRHDPELEPVGAVARPAMRPERTLRTVKIHALEGVEGGFFVQLRVWGPRTQPRRDGRVRVARSPSTSCKRPGPRSVCFLYRRGPLRGDFQGTGETSGDNPTSRPQTPWSGACSVADDRNVPERVAVVVPVPWSVVVSCGASVGACVGAGVLGCCVIVRERRLQRSRIPVLEPDNR